MAIYEVEITRECFVCARTVVRVDAQDEAAAKRLAENMLTMSDEDAVWHDESYRDAEYNYQPTLLKLPTKAD